MPDLLRGIAQALELVLSGDPGLTQIVVLSFQVSGIALCFAALGGLPLGAWLGLSRFRGQGLAIALIYTGMGLPPVVVGLFVYLLLSRQGPLGFLNWLFTPNAMVLAQTIIALQMISGFVMAAVIGGDPDVRRPLSALGATSLQ